ncbi:MAG: arginase family protein, partial [Brevundimonas sp.]
ATGRGEALMTDWPGVGSPLVPDARVIQVGEREGRDADFAWPDVRDSGIERIEIFETLEIGVDAVGARIAAHLDRAPDPRFWVHLDVDVLDQSVMPAVDSPGSPGLDLDQLAALIRPLVARKGCLGMTVTVFDPDLDPDETLARDLVRMLGAVFAA